MLPAGLHIESGWADEERKKKKEKEKDSDWGIGLEFINSYMGIIWDACIKAIYWSTHWKRRMIWLNQAYRSRVYLDEP